MSYLPLMVSYMIRVCVGSTVIKAHLRTAQSYQTDQTDSDQLTLYFCFSHQTAEEIDQLTVDEDLNDIERAVYLLR